ncbi:M14 family zinc carboxypeptidase [Lutimonas sp.]|uniref:M14 family zinc carboxypeptidase n=1 Tax=Lutimonas sp. TaxID=1872403 RepID=UPI003D9BE76D
MDIEKISLWHDQYQVRGFDKRYVRLKDIDPFLKTLNDDFEFVKIGESFQGRDINKIVIGKGKIKVLLWTQMHGNESTGTRALLDLLRFFKIPEGQEELANHILNAITLYCIPILNPDGAVAYTRVNAQSIDLNRDVIAKKAKESQLLQFWLKKINPSYCFNLHDQRNIFSVAPYNRTATMSFLAPSINEERSMNEGRKQTMTVIASINKELQKFIPGQIGRYTDEFYPTATGDNFQKMGHNTILIESGHAKGDSLRRVSRKATFMALIEGLRHIASKDAADMHKAYLEIPNNEKKYLDRIYKNVVVAGERTDLGILLIEKLQKDRIILVPSIDQIMDLKDFAADEIIEADHLDFEDKNAAENWVKNRFN